MANFPSQEFLFRQIRELLPPHNSLVDTVANILHVSPDSAYRRIRGETPIVLDEARELCDHFKLSLDQILSLKSGSMLFQHVYVTSAAYTYEQYLRDLLDRMNYFGNFIHKEIIYRTKDMPLFHNFYFEPLIAFRYFFWMKTIIRHPEFGTMDFSSTCAGKEIISLSRELSRLYSSIPSTEIWNTECINAAISQIEFYRDSGHFSSASDIRLVYEALEETILHLKSQVEYGGKFMPGESREVKKNNFTFFYNRVLLGDNTIIVLADNTKTAFLNYDALNYIFTRDESFCNYCYEDLRSLMKRSTILSETSEKQRNIFFGILLNKVNERKKHL